MEETQAALLPLTRAWQVAAADDLILASAEDDMAFAAENFYDTPNPLDRVERLAESRRWPLDRTSEDEVVMSVAGGWCDLTLSLSWRDDLESLQTVCALDLKVPEARQTEVMRLICLVNARLMQGHFDFWAQGGTILFRDNLSLAGGAEANDAQCDSMIRSGLDNCQRYYPAIQFVIWAGQSAEKAIENALLDTQGEA